MIIVSQDKRGIVNFDNVNMILVREGKVISFDNTYNAGTDDGDLIGKYATEERAKEVLEEIKNAYCCTKILLFPDVTYQGVLKGEDIAKLIAYEMPKE